MIIVVIYYYESIQWIISRIRILWIILPSFRMMYNLIKSYNKNNSTSPYYESHPNYISLKYCVKGNTYNVNIPKSSIFEINHFDYHISLIDNNDQIQQLQQQPGIAYMCTAKQLGGKSICVINDMNGDSKLYTDTAPMFCS